MAGHPQRESVLVELLGGFRVFVEGREVADAGWPGRRSAELVQLLAVSERHQLVRDQVIEALWPHLGPRAGAANLRKAAHHARRALGRQDAIVLRAGRIALFPSCRVETDVERFEGLAEAALRGGDRASCAEAASAYAGDLLPDSLYEEWTQAPRQHLRSRLVRLLRCSGQWDRLVEVEPTDEPAYRGLMRAALAAGNRHAAIRWYGRLRTTLAHELGVLPSNETEALYGECVAGLSVSEPQLVGRQIELSTATAALRSAARDDVGALVVRGSTGIGKSALCRQVASVAQKDAWLVVTVTATQGGLPYAPLAAAVEQLLARDPPLLDSVPDRARAVLGELTSLAAPARPLDATLTRHQVIGAARRVFAGCGHAAGVMLVVDDAHLADDATLEVLLDLVGAGGGVPFLAVLAYRPELAGATLIQGLARLVRAARVVEIDLGPLGRQDAAALVAVGAPTTPRGDVVARIVDLGEGNPFVTLELAPGIVEDAPPAIASTVWEAIAARFLDVDAGTAAMLQRLAVASDDLDPASAPALTGTSESEAFALLDAALDAGVLVVSGARYRFRHELVRQALVERVAPHRRIALHRDIARRLAAAGGPPALVARHWLAGGRPDDAVDPLLAAARQGQARRVRRCARPPGAPGCVRTHARRRALPPGGGPGCAGGRSGTGGLRRRSASRRRAHLTRDPAEGSAGSAQGR